MFPFFIASLTAVDGNQRVNSLGLGQSLPVESVPAPDLQVDVRLGYEQFTHVQTASLICTFIRHGGGGNFHP